MEDQEELHGLVDQISPSATNCPVEEYINGEDDVPTCMQYDDDWESHFFAELGSSQEDSDSLVQEDPDEEEGHFDLEPPPPKISQGFKMPYLHLKLFKHSWTAKDTRKKQQELHPQ